MVQVQVHVFDWFPLGSCSAKPDEALAKLSIKQSNKIVDC